MGMSMMRQVKKLRTSVGKVTFSRRVNEGVLEELEETYLDVWWNLARELEDDIPTMENAARRVLFADIEDYSVPEDEALFLEQLDAVCLVLRRGGHVHVSCYGGRGRTGMALACILRRLEGLDADAALERAHEASRGPEVDAQCELVRRIEIA